MADMMSHLSTLPAHLFDNEAKETNSSNDM